MNFKEYEKKWQDYWADNLSYYVDIHNDVKKYFVLDMFPYPSGAGLHVGHVEGYSATDIIARYKQMCGYNTLHPMGFDAFGLPAEQYALDTGNDPQTFTKQNIENFKKQLKSVGFVYDWSKEVNTTDPNYYKWTQWIFIQLHKQGLAMIKPIEVNWCPNLGTVLANEEVLNIDGQMVSERGHHPVEKKPMNQWTLKITEYAERLLTDLDLLDWPESIKEMQRNWIGKSVGANVIFPCVGKDLQVEVFTTRPDTLFGASYVVIAPEHEIVSAITTTACSSSVNEYIMQSKMKSDLERTQLNKDKTGVFTGSYVINPVNNEQLPIWISDYVLASYGSGMVMAVPAHDQRDYEFATKFDLPIKQVVEGDISAQAFVEDGVHVNSEFLDGLNNAVAITTMIEWLEVNEFGQKQINYKLRDWIFARQRYWGEPFPVIHYEDGSIELVEDLPLELPVLDEFKPSNTGESPLVNAKDWVNVEKNGVKGKRDTNTMPQWAGSCWYYIGYLLKQPDGTILPLDSQAAKTILDKWLPVDLYIGGAEHAVLHLLYARFWHKVLYDIGVVSQKEPFLKLFNQGMILGENNQKMSKSLKNVVNPDEIIANYGADTLRMYEMFMGPLDANKPWNSDNVVAMKKYLDRVWRLLLEVVEFGMQDNLDYEYHLMIKNIINDYETLHFNTIISSLMTFTNEVYKKQTLTKAHALGFLKCLFPIAPHISEELNAQLQLSTTSLVKQSFPTYEEQYLQLAVMTIVVQVNGKLRARLEVANTISKDELLQLAKANEDVAKYLSGKELIKAVYVPNKLINFVVK